jgi:DNA-binding LacI/PurR family transcriptional regulator
MKDGKVNSFDIAARAGVSQSTVSRALRNSPLVNKKTRELVQAIAREMNYTVDKSAANLRTKTSHTIALLLFEDPRPDESMINPFFLSMLGSVTRAAAERGYDLLVSFQQLDQDWHNEYEAAHKADGMILLGYGDYLAYEHKLQQLEQAQAHFIIWGPKVEGQPGFSIGCDNYRGGYEATRHLIQQGRKRIAFIGDHSEGAPEFKLRLEGYLDAQKEMGIEPDSALMRHAENLEVEGESAVKALHAEGLAFDAVFTASDLIAIGVIQGLKSLNIAIPNQVAVIGFDDIPAASYLNPALTTVRQDTQAAGKMLVDRLIRSIEGKEIQSELIPPSLIIRDSCH